MGRLFLRLRFFLWGDPVRRISSDTPFRLGPTARPVDSAVLADSLDLTGVLGFMAVPTVSAQPRPAPD